MFILEKPEKVYGNAAEKKYVLILTEECITKSKYRINSHNMSNIFRCQIPQLCPFV